MLVHTPKALKGSKMNVGFIDVHGGGNIGGSPELNSLASSMWATEFNCIVFNPKYTLIMEGKANDMATDLTAVIKHVRANADMYGIDANKIILHGISGGGCAVLAVCGRLAVDDESHLIKMCILS